MSGSDLDAAVAKAMQLAKPPPPDPDAPDLGLAAGVPVTPPTPPTLEDVGQAARRFSLLQGADTSTGAPVEVRAVVGAAPTADRLANLQRYYPDAQPLPGGGDNFVFTNAQGNRQTYAPIGWRVPTVGDVASVGPEISEGLGGIAGAALAAPTLNPAGIALGGGLGAAAGKSGYQELMRFLGMQDTRTPVQQLTDTATTAGVNAVLPVVGERVAGPLIASLLRPDAPTATQVAAKALDDAGVTTGLASKLPAAVAAESVPTSKIEQPIMSMPFSGGLREAYGDTRSGLETGVQNVATQAAGGQPVPVPDAFASTVGNIAKTIDTTWQANRQAADDAATNLIGANRPVNLQPLRDLRTQLQAKLSAAPASLAPQYSDALTQLDKVLGDATGSGTPALPGGAGTLPYSTVSSIRTAVGKMIDWSQGSLGAPAPTGVPAMQQVYGALKDSLTGAAKDAGPQAEAALAAHDGMVTAYRAPNGPAETFGDLVDPAKRADTITRMMQSTAPQDQNALAHLVQYATPEQRQQLAAGTIQQMGSNPADRGAGFDMTRWQGNYNRMTQTAKDMMFGPTGTQGGLQDSLDNLNTVQRSMSASAANKNFSNTSPTYAVTTALASMTGALAAGKLGAALGAAVPLVAPSLAGRLMTSQPFVKWLTGTYGVNGLDAAQWAAHLGRLGAVAVADPGIADAVTQLRQQLPEQLPSTQ